MSFPRQQIAYWLCLLLGVCGLTGQGRAEEPTPVDFDREVRPIFVAKCVACHGGVKQAGGLSLICRENALAESDSGETILPGDAEGSYLIERISDPDEDYRMPPAEHGARLSDEEVATIRRWIDEGASWGLPWAFRKPQSPSPPTLEKSGDTLWATNEIDLYVLAKLRQEGLKPAPAHRLQQRAQWLRRVTFDLTGLPPTEEEWQNYVFDASLDMIAKQRVVDRLLVSPHFGERWAALWLDLARYADTMGFEKDPPRDIWPYRDWVIQSFNADKPYNEFVIEQMAGDLLPEATIDQRLATAFHRNTQTNTEGGTDDEEFRVAAVVDRVDTTWQAFQGLTFGCARCHDHPYDPISNRDYYRFYACLNNTQDADLREELPKVAVPKDPKQRNLASQLDRQIAAKKESLLRRAAELADDQGGWRGLKVDQATSTDDAEFEFTPIQESINGSASEGTELKVGGTLANNSRYTLVATAPEGRVTALRLDALPKDLATAAHTPEMGFVVSRLRVFRELASSTPEEPREVELYFQTAFCDEAQPFFEVEDSLRDNGGGWCAFSRLWRPRWAVFLFDNTLNGPVVFEAGDRLRIEIKHGKALDGQDAIAIRRLRLSASSSRQWEELLEDKKYQEVRLQLEALENQRRAIKSVPTPCLNERSAGHEREHRMFVRGNWLVKGEQVVPGVPEVFSAWWDEDAKLPVRLRLARWLASEANPLTARVWINRVWAELFGAGLVESLDEFGATGSAATHPELLDYLATTFVKEDGWRLKPLLRRIVLSSTYGQDSHITPEMLERDPWNRLLARGPRSRLDAEMVRDQALQLSGLFNRKQYGPPVMPYQPEGVWNSVYSGAKWETATDENRFRRAIYTYWKRTAGYPSLLAFDAPSREQCTGQRPITNTPLQAFVTMNDPAYVELAEGFAQRMLNQQGPIRNQIAWAGKVATGSHISKEAINALLTLHNDALDSTELVDAQAELFAMSIVANAIMNLDETLTK